MLSEGTGVEEGAIARLESPVYPATFGQCARFWAVLYGSTSKYGTLNVYAKTEAGLGDPLWSVSQSVHFLCSSTMLYNNKYGDFVGD